MRERLRWLDEVTPVEGLACDRGVDGGAFSLCDVYGLDLCEDDDVAGRLCWREEVRGRPPLSCEETCGEPRDGDPLREADRCEGGEET